MRLDAPRRAVRMFFGMMAVGNLGKRALPLGDRAGGSPSRQDLLRRNQPDGACPFEEGDVVEGFWADGIPIQVRSRRAPSVLPPCSTRQAPGQPTAGTPSPNCLTTIYRRGVHRDLLLCR